MPLIGRAAVRHAEMRASGRITAVTRDDDQDPAADLTRRIGAALNRVAMVVFPVGTIVCVLVLLFGDPANPERIVFTGVISAFASLMAYVLIRRRR